MHESETKLVAPQDTKIIPADSSPVSTSENVTSIKPQPSDAVRPFFLDDAERLEVLSFPNQSRSGNSQVLATTPNVIHMLGAYGIVPRYNVIKKKLFITVPGYSGTPDNAANVAMTQILTLATLNGMPTGQIPSIVEAIGDRDPINPVADWIKSKPWDRSDRLPAFYDTLFAREGYPIELKQKLIYRWLLSAVAAALKPSGFMNRGVLTLQGPQGIGKTKFVYSLVPDTILREAVIKLDHHLDAASKDSLITAVSHWIVEIGELDSSFKKDIARLKGFLTSDRDKVRRPYGRADSEYPRRTIFIATVNEHDFLPDPTGNSRWWTIPVIKVNYEHHIDMQQLFAQVAVDFGQGEQWWLKSDEEEMLEDSNKGHRTISAIRERVISAVDLERRNPEGLPAMTATELLREIGIRHPTNTQSKECAVVLREFFGESKRIHGLNKWRVSLKQESLSTRADEDDAKF